MKTLFKSSIFLTFTFWAISFCAQVDVLDGGNVGIGNLNPQYKLDVNGSINFSDSLFQNGVPFSLDGETYWVHEDSLGSIFSNQKVGIKKVNPEYDLDVDGDINFTGQLLKGGVPVEFGTEPVWSGDSLTAFHNGNVGIGTIAPGRILHISTVGEGTGAVIRQEADNNTDAKLELWENGKEWWEAGLRGADASKYYGIGRNLGSGVNFVIDTSGNVGIGTTTPDKQLHMHNATGDAEVKFEGLAKTAIRLYTNEVGSEGDNAAWVWNSANDEISRNWKDESAGTWDVYDRYNTTTKEMSFGIAGYNVKSLGSLLLDGNSSITANPPSAGSIIGWKESYYSTSYARGLASWGIYDKANWVFFGNANPSNNASVTNIDSGADVGINNGEQNIQFQDRGSDVTTPRSGYTAIYSKGDKLYSKNDVGTVTELGGGGESYTKIPLLLTSLRYIRAESNQYQYTPYRKYLYNFVKTEPAFITFNIPPGHKLTHVYIQFVKTTGSGTRTVTVYSIDSPYTTNTVIGTGGVNTEIPVTNSDYSENKSFTAKLYTSANIHGYFYGGYIKVAKI